VELVAGDGADSVCDWLAVLPSLLCEDKHVLAYTHTQR